MDVAVSPAVNWLRQGRCNLLAELRRGSAGQQRVEAAGLRRRETTVRLLRRGATYAEYRAAVGDPDGVTPARWRFISANYTSDAVADPRAMRGTPSCSC
ncbi:hypothetical protein ABZ733_01305 [Streptomyces longwoodensis]|uniref:hypothetical protein n=1 Tax=Streptomyces longwoodensis TaxID=68231 RepID=UPI0033CE4D6C